MNDTPEKDIIEFIIDEFLASDGQLSFHNVYLKPKAKNEIRIKIRRKAHKKFNIPYTNKELQITDLDKALKDIFNNNS